jgi:hypothetical protein
MIIRILRVAVTVRNKVWARHWHATILVDEPALLLRMLMRSIVKSRSTGEETSRVEECTR